MPDLTRSARQIVTDSLTALGVLGVGEVPSADDADLGLRMLQDLFAQWDTLPGMKFNPAVWGDTQVVLPLGRTDAELTTLPAVPDLDTDITLPGEYFSAIKYSLADMMSVEWQIQPTPALMVAMRRAVRILQQRNLIAPAIGDPFFRRRAGSGWGYNIYTGGN